MNEPDPAPPSSERLPGAGVALFALGGLTFPLGVGLGLGYWAADGDMRWVTLVGWVLLLWIAGLLLLIAGSYVQGPLRGNRTGRKRITVFALLAVAVAGGKLAVATVAQPAALTTIPPREFALSYRSDGQQFQRLDQGLQGVIRLLDAQTGLFGPGTARVMSADEEDAVRAAWDTYVHTGLALDQLRRFYEDYWHFDLSRLERDRHVQSFLLTFAAELAVYERTFQLIERVDANPNVATFLNVARPEQGIPENSYAFVREELAGLTDLSRVLAGKDYLAYLNRVHDSRAAIAADGYGWLWREVELRLARITRRRAADLAKLTIAADFAPIKKTLKAWSFPVQKEVAEWMGDTRMRRPGRYLISPAQLETMEPSLEPGDVMLSRKNWYLSNFGLPGFWPHAMLYVGSPERLAAAFDDDPAVRGWVKARCGQELPFTAFMAREHPREWADLVASQEGHHPLVVLEAISEGVVLNSWSHAAGDYLAAMRPRLDPWVKAQAIDRAFGYLGRPYDFDFDFATDHQLVCTEVVWRSYRPLEGAPGLNMAPIKVAGRMALPANEIARLFQQEHGQPDAQLDFVYFLDAREKTQSVSVANEAAYLATPDRPQWDFAQD